MANCNRLFTSRDILKTCFVSSPKLTVIVLEILHECFGDYQPLDFEYKVSSMTESMISPLLMQDTTVDIPFEELSDWEDDFL